MLPEAFETHSAEEVAELTDAQVRILYLGVRDRIAQRQRCIDRDRSQVRKTAAELVRRGLVPRRYSRR